MLNVAICEDCPLQTEVIQILLDKYQAERYDIEMYTHSFSSGADLLKHIDDGHRFNLFLLDILMPKQNGIEFARELRKRDADVTLIFLTSSEDYALEAFSVSAAQYILKPITETKLFPVLDRITAALKLEDERTFVLSAHGKTTKMPFAAIVCIELVGRTLRIDLLDGSTVQSSTLRMSFDEAVEPLLNDLRLLHVHKSFVINMSHAEALGRASFTMKNGVQVPVPRHKYNAAKAKYLEFLSKCGASFIGGA